MRWWVRLLPVFVVVWLARRFERVNVAGQSWHVAFDDVLVLSHEDVLELRKRQEFRRLRRLANKYQTDAELIKKELKSQGGL